MSRLVSAAIGVLALTTSLASPVVVGAPERSRVAFSGTVRAGGSVVGRYEFLAAPTRSVSGDGWYVFENMPMASGHVWSGAQLDGQFRGLEGFVVEELDGVRSATAWAWSNGAYRVVRLRGTERKDLSVPAVSPLLVASVGVLGAGFADDRVVPTRAASFDPVPSAERGEEYAAELTVGRGSRGTDWLVTRGPSRLRLRFDGAGRTLSECTFEGQAITIQREEPAGPDLEISVTGAVVRPLKADGRPWDLSFNSVPPGGWSLLSSATGYPSLRLLGYVPHRNRPDPFTIISLNGLELSRTEVLQGTFLATWMSSRVAVPASCAPTDRLCLELWDADLSEHDWIGGWEIPIGKLRQCSGLVTLHDADQVHELSLLVRRRAEAPRRHVVLHDLRAAVRPYSPSRMPWDGPGNLDMDRIENLPVPDSIRQVAEVFRPDPVLRVEWPDQFLLGPVEQDAFEARATFLGWLGGGRLGSGDGLRVVALDDDLAIDDPIGQFFVPVERFEPGVHRTLRLKGDEKSGISDLSIEYSAW